jgi:hypothetical protein
MGDIVASQFDPWVKPNWHNGILMAYFSGKNQKIDAWRASSKKVDSTFLLGNPFSAFPDQYSSIPLFHAAHHGNDR